MTESSMDIETVLPMYLTIRLKPQILNSIQQDGLEPGSFSPTPPQSVLHQPQWSCGFLPFLLPEQHLGVEIEGGLIRK